MKKVGMAVAFALLLISCAPFVDSPFSDKLLRKERNLNQLGINQLGDIESDGVIRIAVFADPHQNYKAMDKAVYGMNQATGIDFVAGIGDYTNQGYNLEYDQFLDSLKDIKWPQIFAIGNHDSIGAGPELFKKAFGQVNFYFESTSYRFIFFDSNNLEDPDEFDPSWLKSTVDASTKPVIIFSHVQLRDPDRFFNSDASILGSVIEDPKVKIIFNGHNHVYDLSTDHDTIMMQCGRTESDVGGAHWLTVEIQGSQFCVTRMDTMGKECKTIK